MFIIVKKAANCGSVRGRLCLRRYLDFMNILSYDYHSAFEPSVNHHSPLYPMEEENEYNFDTQLCIVSTRAFSCTCMYTGSLSERGVCGVGYVQDYTVKHLIELGADRDKLVVGIPTYGRSYTLFNPDATDIGAPADGPGEQGDATREKGYLAYYEICENLEKNDWEVVQPNPSAMGPYAYKGNQWVGYDDEDIVRRKAKYVSENALGGIMFWAIDNDDFRGKCHGRPYPLIEAGKEAMFISNGLTNEVSGGSGQKRKGSQRPRTGSGGRSSGRKRKNKNRSTTTSTTTTRRTTTTSTTTPKYVTPEPPTTPDPGSGKSARSLLPRH
ncbi:hypothetical protein PR048_009423 [Dryococelus australis]|uniref:GH18 domain-containing protein n=1 Tax=Dryococelus australis TaxID=614101 RepID=A0ABQ9HZU9_9NEOP|nr:hypothetical protein PR048_009423 [Dryococelus australis]